MQKINLNIQIEASPEDVWRVITDPDYYNDWTNVFTKTSHFVGGWNKGDTIRFLAINKDGNLDGMISEIAESVYPSFISIRHLGYVYNGVDDTSSDEIKSWAPAYENYILTKVSDSHTRFELMQEVTDDYYDMFMDLWPKAMKALKETAESIKKKSIYPCLWFDQDAHPAADYYCELFNDSKKFAGNAFMANFEIMGSKFMAMNGGPKYKLTSAVSYYIYCGGDAEIKRLYASLSDGGAIIMPLDKYDWSSQYAWVVDKFGVNWQLDIDVINNDQKIVPTLLFVNDKNQKVKEAMQHYTQIFSPSSILFQSLYHKDKGLPDDTLLFAQFKLKDMIFNAMSSTVAHDFDFTHGNSFVVECKNQEEIDHYWAKLGEGGKYEMCGWLIDKYGVSWQILPWHLGALVKDPEKGQKVIQAFSKMQKFDLDVLINI